MAGSSSMPNPEDGTDEGFDREFWRKLPFADALEVAKKLRTGPKVDEREGTVEFSLEAIDSELSLEHLLTPQPITVDEGGEASRSMCLRSTRRACRPASGPVTAGGTSPGPWPSC